MPEPLTALLAWATGGAGHAYATLVLCMDGDDTWARLLVASKGLIFASYLLVARYLFRRWRVVRRTRFARALLWGAVVFVNCGAVHLLNGLTYVWPGRRLEAVLSLSVALVNVLYVVGLHRLSAVENVLRINVTRPKDGGTRSAEAE